MTSYPTIRFARRTKLLLLALILVVSRGTLRGQQSSSQPTPDAAGSSVVAADPANSTTADSNSRNALTAAQINAVLQQKPEVVVELKSLVADQLTQQGINTQADSITDEMLFSQIASSADLRANITLWLRARGYISEADLQRSLAFSDTDAGDDQSALASRQTFDTLTQLPGTDSVQGRYSSNAALGTYGSSISRSGSQSSLTPRPPNVDKQAQPNVTDAPEVLRLPAPYNLMALRDLYTQIPQDDVKLKRFGSDVYLNRDDTLTGRPGFGARDMPIDLVALPIPFKHI